MTTYNTSTENNVTMSLEDYEKTEAKRRRTGERPDCLTVLYEDGYKEPRYWDSICGFYRYGACHLHG